jgi:hypothetical protein
MKREVVRDFLNLPGIAGVALMDGRSRPYFCGVDQTLNFQQKEALAQGIRQVVETTPDGFESFEFQFTGHQVYIYKLDHGIILLVLARSHLVYTDYLRAINLLKAALQEDITKAIATFRLLASDVTVSGQNYWRQRSEAASSDFSDSSITSQAPTSVTPTEVALPQPNLGENHGSLKQAEAIAAEAQEVGLAPTKSLEVVPSQPSDENTIELKELLAALNHLSEFTTQYLGTAVITNYWKSSRPDIDWLHNFQVDRSAHLVFASPISQSTNQPITAQQQGWAQEWVAAFIKRCSQVIRDFPTIVNQRALDDRQKKLLLQS